MLVEILAMRKTPWLIDNETFESNGELMSTNYSFQVKKTDVLSYNWLSVSDEQILFSEVFTHDSTDGVFEMLSSTIVKTQFEQDILSITTKIMNRMTGLTIVEQLRCWVTEQTVIPAKKSLDEIDLNHVENIDLIVAANDISKLNKEDSIKKFSQIFQQEFLSSIL